MKIEEYDLRTGGSYRYEHSDDSGSYRFAGVFHTVRENEFIVQTFEYLGFPDVVSLETLTFVDLGNVPASWSAIPCTRDRRPATASRKRVWRPA
ncbi:SRPBCC domain-containing protein [Rhodococcus pyridinivorans]|uniref:SRPBCC domain-containing protein n=1 Tax=Rhodococcus pyridinivorans TaxID=103816 RepID=UPI00367D4EC2